MAQAGMATMTFKNYGVGKEAFWLEQQRPYVPPTLELTIPTIDNALIIDMENLKDTIDKWIFDLFENPSMLRTGVLWGAFITYVFPILTDVAKVWCAVQVISSFFKERQGRQGADGKSGWQAFATYGKWYLVFIAIPWFVELVDELGHKMYTNLMKHGLGSENAMDLVNLAHKFHAAVM